MIAEAAGSAEIRGCGEPSSPAARAPYHAMYTNLNIRGLVLIDCDLRSKLPKSRRSRGRPGISWLRICLNSSSVDSRQGKQMLQTCMLGQEIFPSLLSKVRFAASDMPILKSSLEAGRMRLSPSPGSTLMVTNSGLFRSLDRGVDFGLPAHDFGSGSDLS